jgi:hypothetical protein
MAAEHNVGNPTKSPLRARVGGMRPHAAHAALSPPQGPPGRVIAACDDICQGHPHPRVPAAEYARFISGIHERRPASWREPYRGPQIGGGVRNVTRDPFLTS